MNKVRVLHAIGNLSMGGAELQCLRLANNLEPEHCEVGIVYLHDGPNPDAHSTIRLFKIDRGAYWDVWAIYKQIDQSIEEFSPDIVQVWLPEIISVPAAWAAYRRGIPVVSGHRKTLNFSGSYKMMLRDWLSAPQHFLANRVVSNFPVDEEPAWFRAVYKRKNGCVVFNGLDLECIASHEPKRLPMRSEFRLIYAGRLAPQKGISLALDAVSLLRGQGLDIHLTLFGEGSDGYVEKLVTYMKAIELDDGAVTFYGQRQDWQVYAADADALLCPSKGEGTSNVVLEAMASGIPVVISDIAMSRQLLSQNETALIIKTESGEAWAAGILELLNNEALGSTLRGNGVEFAEGFRFSKMVQSYRDLYLNLLASNATT